MRFVRPRIDPNKVANIVDLAKLVDGYRSDLEFLFDNGVLYADNLACKVVELPLQHGVEFALSNPLKTRLQGIHVLDAFDANGNPLSVENSIKINRGRTDGKLGLTAYYDLRHTEPCRIKTMSAATMAVAHNANVDMTGWDTLVKGRGSVITDDGTTFTFSEAGTYSFVVNALWELATYNRVEMWLETVGSGVQGYGHNYAPVSWLEGPWMQAVATIDIGVGGQVKARCYQRNAAVAARTLVGTGNQARYIEIHRLYNDSTPTGTVRCVLVAG